MGVPTRVVLYGDSPATARAAAAAAFARIAELEQVMSDYRPDSEIGRLSAAPAGEPHIVSPDLFDVLTTSQAIAAAAGGAFDVTSGPLVTLWRRSRETLTLPTEAELGLARALVGPHLLTLDPAARTATLARPGMKLDLGGIGKGYAAQAAAEVLQARGHRCTLVALAGDIVTGDPPPATPGWRIELSGPKSGEQSPPTMVLHNTAISTSGGTEQFVEIGGRRYAHIIDPRTGLGLIGCPTVTVIAPRGELADALATTACILGPAHSGSLLSRFGASMP